MSFVITVSVPLDMDRSTMMCPANVGGWKWVTLGWNLVSFGQYAFIATVLSNALFDHGWNLEYMAQTTVIQVLQQQYSVDS